MGGMAGTNTCYFAVYLQWNIKSYNWLSTALSIFLIKNTVPLVVYDNILK